MTHDITNELNKVIASDHHDPFLVLGVHVLEHDPNSAVIRAFLPLAESVRLVLEGEKRDMYKMREEGLFEIVVPDYVVPFKYSFEATYYNNEIRTHIDPYQFLPQLSEYDRHLFNHGTHYNLYDKMGAHPAVINGIEGTMFRVWAPAARRVSVIGNFNYWDGRVHQMRVLGSSGIWELFLPGISPGEIYKYEIRTPTNDIMEKSDPFQFFAEVRPKTASIVWNINDYEWQDKPWYDKKRGGKLYDQPCFGL